MHNNVFHVMTGLKHARVYKLRKPENLTGVGFEPTHPKILRPERSALDRSAILPLQ